MQNDSTAEGIDSDVVAELWAIIEDTRKAIEASQAILDRCVAQPATADGSGSGRCGGVAPDDLIGEIGEVLIQAHHMAQHDGDPTMLTLIERALFHVGRRIARGMSAAEAGLVCH